MSIYRAFKRLQTGPFMIGIAVFGVLTFTITYAFNMTFARDPLKEALFSVTLPSGATKSFSEADRQHAQLTLAVFVDPNSRGSLIARAYEDIRTGRFSKLDLAVLTHQPWISTHLGNAAAAKKDKKSDEVLQMLLVNAVAQDRGIDVAVDEVAEWLSGAFDSTNDYKALVAAYGLTIPQFESALRESLLYRRALDFLLAQTPLPSGDDITKEWCDRNERVTFEVATFTAEDRKKTLKPEEVTNEELSKWLDSRGPAERNKYQVPEKFQMEGIAVTNEMLEPGKPLPAAFEALLKDVILTDADVQTYHSLARLERFKKPAAESKPASAPESGPSTRPIEFYELAEKKEVAEREAKIARGLEKVKAAATEAMAQPNFDLKAIAEKYGLVYFTSGEPKVLSELRNTPVHGCFAWILAGSDVKEGDFLATYQGAPGAIEISRLTKKTPSRVPEIADLRDKLLPDYLDEKALEKARDDAMAFRDAVVDATSTETENRFEKVAKEKSVEVKTLAPISKSALMNGDIGETPDPAKDVSHFLIALQSPRAGEVSPFTLKKDAVSNPLRNNPAKAVHVVYVRDRQFPTIADMTVLDYPKFKEGALIALRQKKCLETIESEMLGKQLNLKRRTETSAAQ